MGIDTRLENRTGNLIRELSDPKGLLNWLLSLSDVDATACLRFIDDYGATVFNRLQFPILRDEFTQLRPFITDERLNQCKQRYLERASDIAHQEAASRVERLSINELTAHLDRVLALLNDAIAGGPRHYVRF